jgi:hypothetical protein
MKISELNEDQKGHLAYRLDHNTYCGFLTAARICNGEFGDLELEEVFKQAGKSPRWAKYYAKKVIEFNADPDEKAAAKTSLEMLPFIMKDIGDNAPNFRQQVMLARNLIRGLEGYARLTEVMVK